MQNPNSNHLSPSAANRTSTVSSSIRVIDSHTAGEPTRVVIAGGPPLGRLSVQQQCEQFATQFDHYRSAIVNEPRGSDVIVGALLCEPLDPTCDAGVIFFNNVGMLGMCGHGTIGMVATLYYLGKLSTGQCKIETPVGVVGATLHEDGSVSVANVPSYREAKDVAIHVPSLGTVRGDIAWGGNWFYLVKEPYFNFTAHSPTSLLQLSTEIRLAINKLYPLVDHVELFGETIHADSQSRNFVLCPGGQYDRSPCGTGTSAKLACLAADGDLKPDEAWVQESILGTQFIGRYQWHDRSKPSIIPTITGRAYITAEAELILNAGDPFCWGIGTKS
jgi:4-hydroxyproline epimerase